MCIKCCYPYTTLLPPAHQWPNAHVQEKVQQEGCDSMASPGLAIWVMWWGQTPLPWHPSPDPPLSTQTQSLPPLQPRKAAGWVGKGGRQLLLLPRHPAHPQGPAAALGTLWPWQSSSCLHGNHEATIVPAGHSQVPDSGRREGDLFK